MANYSQSYLNKLKYPKTKPTLPSYSTGAKKRIRALKSRPHSDTAAPHLRITSATEQTPTPAALCPSRAFLCSAFSKKLQRLGTKAGGHKSQALPGLVLHELMQSEVNIVLCFTKQHRLCFHKYTHLGNVNKMELEGM